MLHVLDTIDSKSGGPVQAMKSAIAHRLDAVIPEIVTLDKPDAPFIASFPYTVHAFGEDHWINRGAPIYRYSTSVVPWLKANAAHYDIVVVHGIWSYNALATWQALKGTNIPYVIYTHGMMDPWFKLAYPRKHLKKQLYWSLFLGKIMTGAKLVLFTSEEERRLARGVFAGYNSYNERVIKYGTVPPPANTDEQIAAFKALMPQVADRRFLLFLSRIDPKKGCDLLIEAFGKVAATFPDVDLVMAGPDRDGWRADLEKIAAMHGITHRIHWPGMLSGDAKWGAFRLADAFVLPSHQENFGISVAEALACGAPVLISNKINIWREIDAAGACLVADDTVDGTTDIIQRFLELAPAKRQEMRQNALDVFHDKFDIRTTAMELVDIVRDEILPQSPRPVAS